MRIWITQRQRQVLELLKQGKNQSQIAQALGCTQVNVSQVLRSIKARYPTLKIWSINRSKIEVEEDEK